MKTVLIIMTVMLSLKKCMPDPESKNLTYQNIIILSDLSSRIDNKPQKDVQEIHKIVQYFKTECVKPGEKIGDKSSISFSSFSDKTIALIDIGKIKQLGEKQSFINSTLKFQNNGLDQKIVEFEQQVNQAYATIRNKGLDLISILVEKMENEPIIKKDTYLTDGVDTTFIKYDNHIYIFTDGYLEYANKQANSQFYFGTPEIEKVRNFCQAKNVSVATALNSNNALGLPIYKSVKNQFVNLHILETHERDKNDKLNTYKYAVGQRDNDILKAVWQKWAINSGFKSLEWSKY